VPLEVSGIHITKGITKGDENFSINFGYGKSRGKASVRNVILISMMECFSEEKP
jgi:hypothetical protein